VSARRSGTDQYWTDLLPSYNIVQKKIPFRTDQGNKFLRVDLKNKSNIPEELVQANGTAHGEWYEKITDRLE
jgi:hypothetical protein